MNKTLLLISILMQVNAVAQFPMNVDTTQYSRSMSDVNGSYADGVYRYIENGDTSFFNGSLYAKYDNGNFQSWQEYEKGVGEGHWINFYENGNLKEWGTYIQNKVEGPIRKYFENGLLKAEGTYREWRVRVGKWTYYDESGKRIKIEDYGVKGDFRDVVEYYKRGDISKTWYESILEANAKYQEN
ncbi:hypothetical protein [Ekhidna sp.]|uniref:toxin-antitoxin system YwqK family antitoxin n=1 Tax=Ekhidna sp. TaxID=2608089 RepID=UPI003297657B